MIVSVLLCLQNILYFKNPEYNTHSSQQHDVTSFDLHTLHGKSLLLPQYEGFEVLQEP